MGGGTQVLPPSEACGFWSLMLGSWRQGGYSQSQQSMGTGPLTVPSITSPFRFIWGESMYPPPPLAHAWPCLSTGWALNRRFEEILGPLFLWSRMEDWVFVERLYRERGAQSSHVCDSALW